MSLIGISIILVFILIVVCTSSFSMSGSDNLDRRAMAFGLITLVSSLALGLSSALFWQTHKPEAFYESFVFPTLTYVAAIVVSLAGLIVGAVQVIRVWRAGRPPG